MVKIVDDLVSKVEKYVRPARQIVRERNKRLALYDLLPSRVALSEFCVGFCRNRGASWAF